MPIVTRRYRADSASFMPRPRADPPTVTEPGCGLSRPAIMFSNVDLPLPEARARRAPHRLTPQTQAIQSRGADGELLAHVSDLDDGDLHWASIGQAFSEAAVTVGRRGVQIVGRGNELSSAEGSSEGMTEATGPPHGRALGEERARPPGGRDRTAALEHSCCARFAPPHAMAARPAHAAPHSAPGPAGQRLVLGRGCCPGAHAHRRRRRARAQPDDQHRNAPLPDGPLGPAGTAVGAQGAGRGRGPPLRRRPGSGRWRWPSSPQHRSSPGAGIR